ncbi:MAG: hypothetical protein LBU88_11115 [Treponema sp.]|jgi:hypothetical protein|nr:hypothetical protein [Treponema sp.]
MKKLKVIFIGVIMLAFVSGAAFSQTDLFNINALQRAIGDFADDVALSLPFNSTMGLNWSDAHIGKFFPSLPPHFGVGITTGFTTFGNGSFDGVLNSIGAGGVIPSELTNLGMPMLGYTVDARIGGFFLPFDVGVKFGIIPPLKLDGYAIDYLLVGADIRYAVVDSKLSPIKVSVGIGYNHLKGGIAVPLGKGLSFEEPTTGYKLSLGDPKLGFLWGTDTIELKGQVSFKLPFITPYAGAGLSMAFSHAGYKFNTNIKVYDDQDTEVASGIPNEVISALNNMGITGVTSNGFESIKKEDSFNMRLFGGISLNLTVVRFDLNVLYNLTGGQVGVTFGARVQI